MLVELQRPSCLQICPPSCVKNTPTTFDYGKYYNAKESAGELPGNCQGTQQ